MPSIRPTFNIVLCFLVLGIVCVPTPGLAFPMAKRCEMAVISVSNSQEFNEALANANGGDTIELAGGDYGTLSLGASFSSTVTIKSADSTNPAEFTAMSLTDTQNVSIENVQFNYAFSLGDPTHYSPFKISDSSEISISNSQFIGDVAFGTSEAADGYGSGRGLYIRGSSNVELDSNEFSTFHRGVVVIESQDVSVTNNDIHSMRSDGLNFSAVETVLIEGNHIYDFLKSPSSADHMDMIQFWTNGTDTPSSHITIRGNVLDIGNGDQSHSILMRNEEVDTGRAGEEMFYQNVLIEDNLIRGGHLHGISVGETDGLSIQNNTLLTIDPSDPNYHSAPTINLTAGSLNVSVTNNVSNGIDIPTESIGAWAVSNNLILQNSNPQADLYYATQFIASSTQGGVQGYILDPAEQLFIGGFGSSLLDFDDTPESIRPAFEVESLLGESSSVVFNAQHTYGPGGHIDAVDAAFVWDFGDGATALGQLVGHTFNASGTYDITLTVTLNDGSSTSEHMQVQIAGDDILTYTASSDAFYVDNHGVEAMVANVGSTELALGASGTALAIPKDALSRFFGTDSFDIFLSVQSNGSSSGEIARLHNSFIVSVDPDGNLVFQLYLADGSVVTATSQNVRINDGDVHDIEIQFDGELETLQLLVDGVAVASAVAAGHTPDMGSWDLVFGNPWGGQNFDGSLLAFDLNARSYDYPFYSGAVEPEPSVIGDADPTDPNNPTPVPVPNPEPEVVVDDDDPGGTTTPDPGPEVITDDSDPVLPSLGTPIIDGSAGNDALWGNQEDNLLNGREGDDTLDSWSGDDKIYAGTGNDSILGGDGNDTLNGDEGNATLDGGSGNDVLAGGWGEDNLFGQNGDDMLWGWLGNDTLNGGLGNDNLHGEEDDDLLDGWSGDDALYGGAGADKLIGGDGADLLNGDEGADTLMGGNGADTLAGGWGDDYAHGEEDDDSVFGWLGNDTLEGGGGNDTLHGEEGNDTVSGGEGDDLLIGGIGNDLLVGWLGDDTLDGGAGDDVMNGEDGNDVFVFFDGHGTDTIEGFEAANDLEDIDLSGVAALTSFAQMQSSGAIRQAGADVMIDTGTGMITLAGVNMSDLDPNDFVF